MALGNGDILLVSIAARSLAIFEWVWDSFMMILISSLLSLALAIISLKEPNNFALKSCFYLNLFLSSAMSVNDNKKQQVLGAVQGYFGHIVAEVVGTLFAQLLFQ